VKESATVPLQATSFWPVLAWFCEGIARLLLSKFEEKNIQLPGITINT